LEAIFNAALDDDHKNQAAAWKLVMDRMLPVSYFEKEASGGRSAVSITISNLGSGDTVISQGESEDQYADEGNIIDAEVIS
jgi:hypothetical protein